MRHILGPAIRAACLTLALSSAGLWARSHHVSDQYIWPVRAKGGGFERIDSRAIQTIPGRLIFQERTALM
jgi:hypothetical protein